MPTTKRRIPVTLPADLEEMLTKFAQHRNLSLSATINLLLREAIELAEDSYWSELADELDHKTKNYLSHDQFWQQLQT